jgi:L-threonylcarbamoyladenylate synthase
VVSPEELRRAAELLRAGGLVAFPTETVYGLGANALDPRAVRRIYEAKGRPATSPLIVHVASVEMARRLAEEWPDEAGVLTARFWPGPLTLIVRKRPCVPPEVTGGLSTVGLRWPAHPIAQELLRLANIPIAAPSANRFTQLSPTTAAHVRAGLGDAVDLILDGGECQVGIESTIVSVAEPSRAVLLRPGIICEGELSAIVPLIRLGAEPEPGAAHLSPGLHTRHYCPRTPLIIADSKDNLNLESSAYVWHSTPKPAGRTLQLPANPRKYAREIYRVLHILDSEGWEQIVVEPVPGGTAWEGVRDRLNRAANRPGSA